MNPLRRLLRYTLGNLSRHAIKKHNLELIVISGWYGTELAREMLYTILNEKLRVRRNLKDIWWDFSIPLAILGYKDKRRNPIQWLGLLLRASIYLIYGRSNPHILILNADCTYETTAKYWASFVKPDYLLILNYEKEASVVNELIKATDREKGIIIYNPGKFKELNRKLKDYRTFTYGESEKSRLKVSLQKNKLKVSYNNDHVNLPARTLPSFSVDMLAICMVKDLDLVEAGFNSLKFDLQAEIVTKISNNLEFKGLQ